MLSVYDAVKIASSSLTNLFPLAKLIRVEEVELSDDDQFWLITLSYIEADPQLIILSDGAFVTADSVEARPGWSVMTAVKGGAIVAVDDTIVTRPGPRLLEGLLADNRPDVRFWALQVIGRRRSSLSWACRCACRAPGGCCVRSL